MCVWVTTDGRTHEVYHVRGGEWKGEKEREMDTISVLSNSGLPLPGFLFFLSDLENTPQGKAAHDEDQQQQTQRKTTREKQPKKESMTRRLDTKFVLV